MKRRKREKEKKKLNRRKTRKNQSKKPWKVFSQWMVSDTLFHVWSRSVKTTKYRLKKYMFLHLVPTSIATSNTTVTATTLTTTTVSSRSISAPEPSTSSATKTTMVTRENQLDFSSSTEGTSHSWTSIPQINWFILHSLPWN